MEILWPTNVSLGNKFSGCWHDITNKTGETPFQIATRFPKIKTQEYNQQLETYKKSGVKQKDPIDHVIKMASEKSNDMAKLFIAQNLSHHSKKK